MLVREMSAVEDSTIRETDPAYATCLKKVEATNAADGAGAPRMLGPPPR